VQTWRVTAKDQPKKTEQVRMLVLSQQKIPEMIGSSEEAEQFRLRLIHSASTVKIVLGNDRACSGHFDRNRMWSEQELVKGPSDRYRHQTSLVCSRNLFIHPMNFDLMIIFTINSKNQTVLLWRNTSSPGGNAVCGRKRHFSEAPNLITLKG